MPSPRWYEKWTREVRDLPERMVGIHVPVAEHAEDVFNIMAYWFDHIAHHHDVQPLLKDEKDNWQFGNTPDGRYLGSMSARTMEEWHNEYYGEHAHGHKTLLLGVW